jgi:hypothetical protein
MQHEFIAAVQRLSGRRVTGFVLVTTSAPTSRFEPLFLADGPLQRDASAVGRGRFS